MGEIVLQGPTTLGRGDAERLEAMAVSLAAATDAKGKYDPAHCEAVGRLVHGIAHRMGYRGLTLLRLRLAGLLHDVGKLQIDDDVLLKPGKLTAGEYDFIKRHSVFGHTLITSLGLCDEARWVLHHHERPDGKGYPSGLRDDAVPMGSRIIHVADSYHCMIAPRTYKAAMSPDHAMQELVDGVGSQFDGHVVEAFVEFMSRGRVLIRD